jgi:hypothetical protein
MRSLTADRIRCLQPGERSVVCTGTCPKRNWICSNAPPEAGQSRAQVRHRSGGANVDPPMLLADSFTMCQTAFPVIPSPHGLPTLLTRQNSLPRSMAAATTQSFNSLLTQSGTGTVRTWPPAKVADGQLLGDGDLALVGSFPADHHLEQRCLGRAPLGPTSPTFSLGFN